MKTKLADTPQETSYMEQKTAGDIQSAITELNQLFAAIGEKQLSTFLDDPITMETAAELSSDIVEIYEKLTWLGKIYPLCRDDRFREIPASLHKNAWEIRDRCTNNTTIEYLKYTISIFYERIIQHCIQIEVTIAYSAIDNNQTVDAKLAGEKFAKAIKIILDVLGQTIHFVSNAITTDEMQHVMSVNASVEKDVESIFSLFDEITEKIDRLKKDCYGKNHPVLIKIAACIISIAEILKKYQDQDNMPGGSDSLVKIFDEINYVLSFLVARLTIMEPADSVLAKIESPLPSVKQTVQNQLAYHLKILEGYVTARFHGGVSSKAPENRVAIVTEYSLFLQSCSNAQKTLEQIDLLTNHKDIVDVEISKKFVGFIDQLQPNNNNLLQLTLMSVKMLVVAVDTMLQEAYQKLLKQISVRIQKSSPVLVLSELLLDRISIPLLPKVSDPFKDLDNHLIIFTHTHDDTLNHPRTIELVTSRMKQAIISSLHSNFCDGCRTVREKVEAIKTIVHSNPQVRQDLMQCHINLWCYLANQRINHIKNLDLSSYESLFAWLNDEIMFLHEQIIARLDFYYQELCSMRIDTTKPLNLARPKLHYFRFFYSQKYQPAGFHILSPNEELNHLAHFYLICKDWPLVVSTPCVMALPYRYINLIFWWVLKLSTDEEKKSLYEGRTKGLPLATDTICLEIKKKSSDTVKKFFTVLQVIKPTQEQSIFDPASSNTRFSC